MSDVVLRLENVSCAYYRRRNLFRTEAFWPLKDINFEVYKGETLGVIGRNGAGKSTLLRLLAGVYMPDKGKIWRQEPLRASLLALGVGFLPDLTGRENATLGGMLLGLTRKEVKAKMEEIKAFADIGNFFEEPLFSYSSGMRGRLGFSVAHFADPDILLIDEVLGVGDQDFKIKSSAALKEKIKQDKTVVLVSHSMPSLQELCQRVLWLENSQIYMLGETQEVLEAYRAAARKG